MGEMIIRVESLPALQLGVLRQKPEQRLRRVPVGHRLTGVSEEEPTSFRVVPEHLGHAVGPAGE